jgi:hypothetical protein
LGGWGGAGGGGGGGPPPPPAAAGGGGEDVEATQAPPKSKVVSLEKLDYFYIWRI